MNAPCREFLLTFRSQQCRQCQTTVWCQNQSRMVGGDSIFISSVEEEDTLPLGTAFTGMVPPMGSRSACVPALLDFWLILKNKKPKHLLLTCYILKRPWTTEPASHPSLKVLQEEGLSGDWVGNMSIKGFPGNMSLPDLPTPTAEAHVTERPSTPNMSQPAAHTRSR